MQTLRSRLVDGAGFAIGGIAALAAAFVVATTAASAQSVTDGDTLKFGKQLVRLYGIDAPERLQPCDDGTWWPGPLATAALEAFIAGRDVVCHQVDYDGRNKRPVSRCFAGGDDMQAYMVRAGWAWAYLQYSSEFQEAERLASTQGVGVHAHRCDKPWEWRAKKRSNVK